MYLIIHASGRGWAVDNLQGNRYGVGDSLDAAVEIAARVADLTGPVTVVVRNELGVVQRTTRIEPQTFPVEPTDGQPTEGSVTSGWEEPHRSQELAVQPDSGPGRDAPKPVPASAHALSPSPQPEPVVTELNLIRQEKKQADKAVKFFLGFVLPVLGLVFGSALNGAISPTVASERSVSGVFLATLAWSAAVALFVFLLRSKVLGQPSGMGYFFVAVLCLAVGATAANAISMGTYDVPVEPSSSDPRRIVEAFLGAAIVTFGPIGVMISTIVGVLVGWWVVRVYRRA